MFQIKFWGVRGTLPCSGSDYQIYGGNTCCVSVVSGKSLIVFDAGSGMFPLGQWILTQEFHNIHVLLSHVHFDHIIGFPYFQPIWKAGNAISIYGGSLADEGGLEKFFEEKMNHPLFPGALARMAQANLTFVDIKPGSPFSLEDKIQVKTFALNHPGGSTGYRLEVGGKSLCYLTDTEHKIGSHDSTLVDFVKGSDCLIYDGAYTPEEHKKKIGWGHSTWEEAAYIAKAANVKKLVLYHHDPSHKDSFMNEIEIKLKNAYPQSVVARQDMTINC